jgi:GNAT superfamily N-acetyltransferase
MNNFIIHKNKTPFGLVWHIVYKPGIGLIELEFDKNAKTYYLYGLVVCKKERKKGIATKLLNVAEKIAYKNGCTKIQLNVDMNFKKLLPFYTKRGYIIENNYKNCKNYYLHKILSDI